MSQKNNSALIAVISVVATLFFVMIIAVVILLIKFLPNDPTDPTTPSNTNPSQNSSYGQQSNSNTQQNSSTQQQTPTTMYVANVKNSIYLRSKPAEDSSNIITTIPVGTAVLWLENVDTVFSKVEYNGTTGYVKRDYLSATKPQAQTYNNTTISKYVYVVNVKNSIYLRSTAAETSGNIITTIPLGAQVGYIERANSTFSKISYKGNIGYAKTKYLSDMAPYQGSNTTISKYMYVANVKNSIYLRSTAAETSGNVITTIPLGTQVGYIERTNGTFSKINYNGTIGYVKTQYLSDYYSTGYTYFTVYNVKNSIYLRSTPKEVSNNIICTIPLGTTVRYMGESSNGFHKISYNGYVGYSKAIYLK